MLEQFSEAQILQMLNQCLEENSFQDISQILNLYFSQVSNPSDQFVYAAKILQNAMRYKVDMLALEQAQLTKSEYERVRVLYDPPVIAYQSQPRQDMKISSDDIWWCWLQGFEQAPEIVKACYHSICQLGRTIHILTSDNYLDYVTLPEYVIEKWKQGMIPNANFCDMLRLELLTTYGGTWIDATVYLTAPDTLEIAQRQALFVYHHIFCGIDSDYVNCASWLIHSNGNSKILSETKNMMYQYWQNENQLSYYLLVNLFFTLACKRYPTEWENVPVYSDVPPHVLQFEAMRPYSKERWEQICKMSDIHKLTYKDKRPETEKFLFYDYLLTDINEVE